MALHDGATCQNGYGICLRLKLFLICSEVLAYFKPCVVVILCIKKQQQLLLPTLAIISFQIAFNVLFLLISVCMIDHAIVDSERVRSKSGNLMQSYIIGTLINCHLMFGALLKHSTVHNDIGVSKMLRVSSQRMIRSIFFGKEWASNYPCV